MARAVIAVALAMVLLASVVSAKNIHTSVTSRWNQTGLLAETLEALNRFDSTLFWQAMDDIAADSAEIGDLQSQVAQFEFATKKLLPKVLTGGADGHESSLVNLELAARIYSPLVEMHRQLAESDASAGSSCSGAFAHFLNADKVVCVSNNAELLDAINVISADKCDASTGLAALAASVTAQDRVYPGSSFDECRTVVLYGDFASAEARAAHARFAFSANSGKIRYVFRHGRSAFDGDEWTMPVALQGYGVLLDLKNMEYKAVDEKKENAAPAEGEAEDAAADEDVVVGGFDIKRLKERHPEMAVGLTEFAEEVATAASKKKDDQDVELKVWELQNLGLQAAQHVVSNRSNALPALVDMLNNFPIRAAKISKLSVDSNEKLHAGVKQVNSMAGKGTNALYINGRTFDIDRSDLFSVLEALRTEEAFMNRLSAAVRADGQQGKLATPSSDNVLESAVAAIKSCPIGKSSPSSSGGGETDAADAKRFWLDHDAVTWLNDIEKDKMYSTLGKDVDELLKPGYYGQPRFPRRNLFHLVYVIDPSSRDNIRVLYSMARMFEQGVAVRFGLVLLDRDAPTSAKAAAAVDVDGNIKTDAKLAEPSVAALAQAAAAAVAAKAGRQMNAIHFLQALYSDGADAVAKSDVITEAANFQVTEDMIYESLNDPKEVARCIHVMNSMRQLGVTEGPVAFFNGIMIKENLEYALHTGFNSDFPWFRKLAGSKVLPNDVPDLYTWVMEKTDAMKRFQPAIFESNEAVSFESAGHAKLLAGQTWMYSTEYDYSSPQHSHIIVVDPASKTGITAARRAADYITECKDNCKQSRVSYLFCPAEGDEVGSELQAALETVVVVAGNRGESKRAAVMQQFLQLLDDNVDAEGKAIATKAAVEATFSTIISQLDPKLRPHFESIDPEVINAALERTWTSCQIIRNTASSALPNSAITNGRVTKLSETFLQSDYALLEDVMKPAISAASSCVFEADWASILPDMGSDDLGNEFLGNKLFQVYSVLKADEVTRGAKLNLQQLPSTRLHNVFRVNADSVAKHEVYAIIDPVNRQSQRLANLLHLLSSTLSLRLTVCLNPPTALSAVPIKNYYKFVAEPKVTFDAKGLIAAPNAFFKGMPTKVLLTMGLDEPEAWLVFASVAQHDLDNIKLETLSRYTPTLYAEYQLQSILITGNCVDLTMEKPPRGLPLVVTTQQGKVTRAEGAKDTLVMSNYGYMQLQGAPGVWYLSIQEGRASEVYEMVGVYPPSTEKVSDEDRKEGPSRVHRIAVSSFTGANVAVRVQKQKGQEYASILIDENSKGMDASATNAGDAAVWPPTKGDRESAPAKPTLNIFSVASGHLYERFMRMMIYTVMQSSSDKYGKNTTRIKFWMIENFLSPKFKQFLPKLAAEFGFEYGLVTYRWPYWLRRQTEKQRIIWAYKILFLDVLFPLDVEKIIFVDADQIVRADLHELYNMDLNGKPVGYTPFCQKNRNDETKGFRFWDSGYWVDHLRGLPYHISAIYVVDLKQLRLRAAGDQYRMIYDSLSADPNSLSNLDQDLPNFAQHQVPIHSLPEEWLWCETWCTQESKVNAKTIDLCNNPLTKTPKLENAKRIIPNWTDMDELLEKLEKRDD